MRRNNFKIIVMKQSVFFLIAGFCLFLPAFAGDKGAHVAVAPVSVRAGKHATLNFKLRHSGPDLSKSDIDAGESQIVIEIPVGQMDKGLTPALEHIDRRVEASGKVKWDVERRGNKFVLRPVMTENDVIRDGDGADFSLGDMLISSLSTGLDSIMLAIPVRGGLGKHQVSPAALSIKKRNKKKKPDINWAIPWKKDLHLAETVIYRISVTNAKKVWVAGDSDKYKNVNAPEKSMTCPDPAKLCVGTLTFAPTDEIADKSDGKAFTIKVYASSQASPDSEEHEAVKEIGHVMYFPKVEYFKNAFSKIGRLVNVAYSMRDKRSYAYWSGSHINYVVKHADVIDFYCGDDGAISDRKIKRVDVGWEKGAHSDNRSIYIPLGGCKDKNFFVSTGRRQESIGGSSWNIDPYNVRIVASAEINNGNSSLKKGHTEIEQRFSIQLNSSIYTGHGRKITNITAFYNGTGSTHIGFENLSGDDYLPFPWTFRKRDIKCKATFNTFNNDQPHEFISSAVASGEWGLSDDCAHHRERCCDQNTLFNYVAPQNYEPFPLQ